MEHDKFTRLTVSPENLNESGGIMHLNAEGQVELAQAIRMIPHLVSPEHLGEGVGVPDLNSFGEIELAAAVLEGRLNGNRWVALEVVHEGTLRGEVELYDDLGTVQTPRPKYLRFGKADILAHYCFLMKGGFARGGERFEIDASGIPDDALLVIRVQPNAASASVPADAPAPPDAARMGFLRIYSALYDAGSKEREGQCSLIQPS